MLLHTAASQQRRGAAAGATPPPHRPAGAAAAAPRWRACPQKGQRASRDPRVDGGGARPDAAAAAVAQRPRVPPRATAAAAGTRRHGWHDARRGPAAARTHRGGVAAAGQHAVRAQEPDAVEGEWTAPPQAIKRGDRYAGELKQTGPGNQSGQTGTGNQKQRRVQGQAQETGPDQELEQAGGTKSTSWHAWAAGKQVATNRGTGRHWQHGKWQLMHPTAGTGSMVMRGGSGHACAGVLLAGLASRQFGRRRWQSGGTSGSWRGVVVAMQQQQQRQRRRPHCGQEQWSVCACVTGKGLVAMAAAAASMVRWGSLHWSGRHPLHRRSHRRSQRLRRGGRRHRCCPLGA